MGTVQHSPSKCPIQHAAGAESTPPRSWLMGAKLIRSQASLQPLARSAGRARVYVSGRAHALLAKAAAAEWTVARQVRRLALDAAPPAAVARGAHRLAVSPTQWPSLHCGTRDSSNGVTKWYLVARTARVRPAASSQLVARSTLAMRAQ